MMSLRKAVVRALLLSTYEQFPLGSPLTRASPVHACALRWKNQQEKSRPEGRLSGSSHCLAVQGSNQNLCWIPTSNMVDLASSPADPVPQPSPLFLPKSA
jgi:hypothetical protein